MALSDTDLLLIQRGGTPLKTTADELASYSNSKIELGDSKDIPIASASQLGVIKVGTNLDITADGTLSAVIPPGLTYKGSWTNPNVPPSPVVNGEFYVWDGATSTLNNTLWGTANGQTVTEGDRLLYDGNSWAIITGGGSGGLVEITGTAPIVVSAISDNEQDVSIPSATASRDGYMPKEAFSKLSNIEDGAQVNPDLSAELEKLAGIEEGAQVNVNPTQTYTAASGNGTLTLSPGGDTTTVPVVDGVNAGLMSPGDKTKLDNLEAGELNVDPTQTYTSAPGNGTLTLTPGGDQTVIPLVDNTNAGLMSPTDKTKLQDIEEGAQVNPDLSSYIKDTDSIGRLGDVDLSVAPEADQVLTYNGTNWVALNSQGGGGGGTGVDTFPGDIPGSSLVTSETTISSVNGYVLSKLSTEDDSAYANNRTYLPGSVILFDWAAGIFDTVPHGETVEDTVSMRSAVTDVTKDVSYTVDKIPEAFTLSTLTDVTVGGAVEDPEIITVEGINAPANVWGTTTSQGAEVSIAGGAYVPLPALVATTLFVNEGETVQVRHTTPPTALEQVETVLSIGWSTADSANATFTTTNMDAGVATPTWTAPTEGEIDVDLKAVLITSTFSSFGGAGNHLNTDWQIASDATFSTIVQQSMADASNKTTWTVPTNLPTNTPLFARVRYRADGVSNLESAWSEVSFTTADLLPPLVNGTISLGAGQTWTVPIQIGTVRFTAEGAQAERGGAHAGKEEATYEVSAGDVFRVDSIPYGPNNAQGAGARAGVGMMIGPDGGSTLTQGTLWVCAGGQGGARNSSGATVGGDCFGGGPNGGRSNYDNTPRNGGGGTQSSGGAGGNDNGGQQDPTKIGAPGSALQGGRVADNGTNGGRGAGGWYGGGGGAHEGGFGGGGSGHVRGPNPQDINHEPNVTNASRVLITY